MANKKGVFDYLCPEWKDYTGQTDREAFGHGWLAKVHEDDKEIVRSTFAEAATREAEFSARFRVHRADGTTRWIGAGGIPSFGPPSRTFLGYLGSMTEMVTSTTDALVAYGSIGVFKPPPPHPSTMAISSLDLVADHLLSVHGLLVEGEHKDALPAIRQALFLVGSVLARQIHPSARVD